MNVSLRRSARSAPRSTAPAGRRPRPARWPAAGAGLTGLAPIGMRWRRARTCGRATRDSHKGIPRSLAPGIRRDLLFISIFTAAAALRGPPSAPADRRNTAIAGRTGSLAPNTKSTISQGVFAFCREYLANRDLLQYDSCFCYEHELSSVPDNAFPRHRPCRSPYSAPLRALPGVAPSPRRPRGAVAAAFTIEARSACTAHCLSPGRTASARACCRQSGVPGR